ncbi:hypothetical protein, partial [Microvirga tunisiensis]|uniref:hypothetical protein n=1 Tax=Microvirga tunisiensis TaxID=2108360 RepID=UPI001AEE5431
KGLSLDLNSLGQQLASASPQNIGQGIVNRVGLTKADNVGSLVRGVSLSRRGSGRLDTRLDTPPFSHRHHPVSAIAHMSRITAEPTGAMLPNVTSNAGTNHETVSPHSELL